MSQHIPNVSNASLTLQDDETIKRLRTAIETKDTTLRQRLYYVRQLEGQEDHLEEESMERLVELMGIVTYTQKTIGLIINRKAEASKTIEKVVVDACPVCREHVPANLILACGHGYCVRCINTLKVKNHVDHYRCGLCRHVTLGYVKALNIREEMQVD